jgi:hypothetical protein
MERRLLVVAVARVAACTTQVGPDATGRSATDGRQRASPSAAAARSPAGQHPDAQMYPDAVVRRLWRLLE